MVGGIKTVDLIQDSRFQTILTFRIHVDRSMFNIYRGGERRRKRAKTPPRLSPR